MGQDYSYSQPSSSDEFDMTYLLEAEAAIYSDEGQSSFSVGEPAAIATSYTRKDPGRLYYTCENRDDGGCHIWKWWDVAVIEEVFEVQRELRLLKEQGFEKTLCELKKNKDSTNGYALEVCVMVSVLVFLGLALMFVNGSAVGSRVLQCTGFYLPANEALRFLPKERLGNLQFLQRGDLPPSDPSSCTHIPGGHGPPCPVQ
ncbi:hypothetical protein Bca4012_004837 [Brassica carinata]